MRDDRRAAALIPWSNQIIGAMPIGAGLTERLCNQQGLSYQAGTDVHFSSFDQHGSMTIGATYPPGQGERVNPIVQDTLAQLVKEGGQRQRT